MERFAFRDVWTAMRFARFDKAIEVWARFNLDGRALCTLEKCEFPFQASRFEHEGDTFRGSRLQATVRGDLTTDCRGGS